MILIDETHFNIIEYLVLLITIKLIDVVKLINILLLFKHFWWPIVRLNWLAYLFAWWIFNALKTFVLKVSNVAFFFNSSDLFVIDLRMSTSCTFAHDHSLLYVFDPNTDDGLLEILVSAIVIFIFIFIFHLLSLILNIITFYFSNVFILTSFWLLSCCSVSSANSVGASLRFYHTGADLVLEFLIRALPTFLAFESCISFARLFLLMLLKISVVTSHWDMWNIRNSLI